MNNFCRDIEFTTAVNTLATAIAAKFDNVDELAVVGAIFVQMGDTLATIAANRNLCDNLKSKKTLPN